MSTIPQIPGVTTEQGLKTEDLVVNIGPQHPSTHGVLRLITTLNGEVVKDMEPVIGYLHRSKEKMAETRSFFQYQPTLDRVEYLSSFFDHYVYVTSIEKIAGLKVPKRVEYVRMITMELNRIPRTCSGSAPSCLISARQPPVLRLPRARRGLQAL